MQAEKLMCIQQVASFPISSSFSLLAVFHFQTASDEKPEGETGNKAYSRPTNCGAHSRPPNYKEGLIFIILVIIYPQQKNVSVCNISLLNGTVHLCGIGHQVIMTVLTEVYALPHHQLI